MVRKQVIFSDLTGTEVDEQEAVKVVVHRGPNITRTVSFDALPSELSDGDAPDAYLVELQYYDPSRPVQELLAAIKDLKRIAPGGNLEQFLHDASPNIGRPRGSRNT